MSYKRFEDNCTLVISSCDAYEDLWQPFFKILKEEWPELNLPILLNTESKKFKFPGFDIKCLSLAEQYGNMRWGKRLKLTLRSIDTEYVLMMLDDFFLKDHVNQLQIQKCYEWMQNDKNIAVFYYMPTRSKNKKSIQYKGYEQIPLFAPYRYNCQAALWRKRDLIQALRNFETPWEWEVYGTWRSHRKLFKKFYSLCPNEPEVIPYIYTIDDYSWGGLALYRGKWYLPCVSPIFDKHEIKMDFYKRGTVDKEAFIPQPVKTKDDYEGIKKKGYFIIVCYKKIMKLKNIIIHFKHLF